MTLQTGAVALIAAAYGWRLGAATVVLYLLEGALGLPVFSGTPERGIGLPYMMGPTGGFLLGFAVEAAVVGWLAERGFDRNPFKLFGAMLLGDAVVFVLGFGWLAWIAALSSGAHGIGASAAFQNGVVPFVLGDLVKLALAAAAGLGRRAPRQALSGSLSARFRHPALGDAVAGVQALACAHQRRPLARAVGSRR